MESVPYYPQQNKNLQGGVKFSTGGKAHEPQGMIRCNSEADSIVWMKEESDIRLNRTDQTCVILQNERSGMQIPELFCVIHGKVLCYIF